MATEQELKEQYKKEMEHAALYEQYQKEMGQHPDEPVDTTFLEESHPDISATDRALVKNFSKDDETTKQYLSTKYPQLEFQNHPGDGRLFAKRANEDQYRALDPDNASMSGMASYFSHPKEFLQDVGDIGYDIGAGVGESAAAATAAAAAIPTTGGLGSIPAAMGAGAATGGGLEILRQKAGKILGLPQDELDMKQVGGAAAVGGASPLLFGTGVGVKQLAKHAGKETAEELLRSQRGLVGRGYDVATEHVFPKAAELITGVPAQATKTMAKKLDKLDELNSEGILGYAEDVHHNFTRGLAEIKNKVGKNLEETLTNAGKTVNIREAKEHFKNQMRDLMQDGIENEESKNLAKSMKEEYMNLFGRWEDIVKTDPATGAKRKVGKKWVELGDEIDPRKAFSLQNQLKDSAELFRTKDGVTPRFGASATSADKKGMEVSREAYNHLNKEFDRVTGSVSTKLKDEYKNLSALQRHLQPAFKDPSTTFNTLSNLGSKRRKPLFETLERMKKNYGIDLVTPAKELEAFSYYGKPSIETMSHGGTTSTTRSVPLSAIGGGVGSYLGWMAGGGPGAVLGTGVGLTLGSKMGSPAVTKGLVRAGKAVEKVGGKVNPGPKTKNAVTNSLWHMMNERE